MLLFSYMHVEKSVRRSHKTARNRSCVTTLIYLKLDQEEKKCLYSHFRLNDDFGALYIFLEILILTVLSY